MVQYALPVINDQGVKILVPLQNGTLGYPHVIMLDDLGNQVELPNVPPEAPPVGRFPVIDALGAVAALISFEVLNAVGNGPAVLLRAYLGSRITERWRMVQMNDQSRIEFELFDDKGPIDLTGALTLEVKCQRADHSFLTKAASSAEPTTGKMSAQLDSGDVNGFGEWLMQAHVILAGGREFYSTLRRVNVEPNV